LRRSGAEFDVYESVPTEYGFKKVKELYSDAKKAYIGDTYDAGKIGMP